MADFVISHYRNPANPGSPILPRAEWDRAPFNRWSFQHVRELMPTARVWRGPGPVSPLPWALADINPIAFELDGVEKTIGSFLEASHTDGFIVLHKGRIVAEHYLNGMRPETMHLSQSVAKSVVGTVAGILIGQGHIDPQAPVTQYLPELEKTAYRGATIQHLLDMTSGVVFDETYTAADSHMAMLDAACGWKPPLDPSWPKTVWELILSLTKSECAHGESFRYRSIETDVLAFVMQRVSGLLLAQLVSRELWAPMGAEEDACFTVDAGGYALADGGFNASLRDYARFGLLIANDGIANGQQIVPKAWIAEGRRGDPQKFGKDYRVVLPNGAYHNQFWIEEAGRPVLIARGVFGQLIYIDPENQFVAVKLSSWPEFLHATNTRRALAAIRAVRAAVV